MTRGDDDVIYAYLGDDFIEAGDGDDGADWNDQLFGQALDNLLLGGAGPDILDGRGGSDTLIGGQGARTDGSTGQVGDAALSFTPSQGADSTYQSDKYINRNYRGNMEKFTRDIRDSGLRTPVEGRFAEPEMAYSDIPELISLRAGLNSSSVSLTAQGLSFDMPSDINVFDYFEQPPVVASLTAEAPQSTISEMNILTDVTSSGSASEAPDSAVQMSMESMPIERIGLPTLQIENSIGDNRVSFTELGISDTTQPGDPESLVSNDMVVEDPIDNAAAPSSSGATETIAIANESEVSEASEAKENSDAPGIRAGMLPMEVQGGPAQVDPDIVKLALMTQDMSVFGATSAVTSTKLQAQNSPIADFLLG